jgi:hypothetical protein
MAKFKIDPPHIIRARVASAHTIRDPLYGGETPWDGDTMDERDFRRVRCAPSPPKLVTTPEVQ